ncbi:MAG: carbamoyl phosphate synthase large subunit, partial [Candidatus Diapherotrites archaeon]|nr:carbamoyl phosphate synthase large subunit [Candidatus Diapherotrites archaeon]
EKLQRIEKSALDLDHVGIKAPQFSFSRLKGADPLLGVEMSSTGEVACLGNDVEDAFLKSIIAAGFVVPKKNVLVSVGGDENRFDLLDEIRALKLIGLNLFATDTTHAFLKKQGIDSRIIHKIQEKRKPNVMDLFREKQLDLVIAIPNEFDRASLEAEYKLRRSAIDFNIPLITNRQLAKLLIHSISKKKLDDLEIKHWQEYMEKA